MSLWYVLITESSFLLLLRSSLVFNPWSRLPAASKVGMHGFSSAFAPLDLVNAEADPMGEDVEGRVGIGHRTSC